MNDQPDSEPQDETAPQDAQRTGNPTVDDVLDSLDGLGDQPVDDHVAVFEGAHDQLRKALDGVSNGASAGAHTGIGNMPRPGN